MDTKYRTLSELSFDPAKNIFTHPDSCTSEFHDDRKRDIVTGLEKKCDLSSQSSQFNQHIKDLFTRDHVSRRRFNILDEVHEILPRDATVLELGSGCGAITRWLGERFRSIDTLEGNVQRAAITRYRTRDRPFWNVIAGSGNRLVCIDKKWGSRAPIPIDFFIFRNLLHIFALIKPFTKNKDRVLFTSTIVKKVFPEYSCERFLDAVQRGEAFPQCTIARDWKLAKEHQLRSVFLEDAKIGDIFTFDRSISGRDSRRSAYGTGIISSFTHEIMRQLNRIRSISHSRKDTPNTDLITRRKKKP